MSNEPIRILLVEDNPADARLLRENLAEAQGLRWQIAHAPSLDRALALLSVSQYDVVLLDLGLPESHGLDTLVRVHGMCTELPIVVITGLDDEDTGLQSVQAGAQGYLIKGQLDARTLVRTIRHAIERHRMITELDMARRREHHLATHDGLTGLPNRQLFFDLLGQSMSYCSRYGQWAAVMFVDLDRFKHVNDTHGHDIGDRLLQMVSRRLSSCIRAADTAARLGGDEFIVLLSSMNRTQDASTVARGIIAELSKPYVIGEVSASISPSIGIAIYPGDGTRPDILVRSADAAMYTAKRHGGRTYEFFSPNMVVPRPEMRLAEQALRQALAGDDLRLFYQPVVEAASGRIVSAEALLRWQHPELGTLGPPEFLQLAEAWGLMGAIGEWSLRAACAQARAWDEGGYPEVRVTVNLSTAELRREELDDTVASALKEAGLPPDRLQLEVRESSLASLDTRGTGQLRRLHERGVRIAIDCGGAVAPEALLRLRPAALKIDRDLVRGLGRDAEATRALDAVLELAARGRLGTVAQGVEKREQLEELRSRDCRHVQGYYFSQALPTTDFNHLLRDGMLPMDEPTVAV